MRTIFNVFCLDCVWNAFLPIHFLSSFFFAAHQLNNMCLWIKTKKKTNVCVYARVRSRSPNTFFPFIFYFICGFLHCNMILLLLFISIDCIYSYVAFLHIRNDVWIFLKCDIVNYIQTRLVFVCIYMHSIEYCCCWFSTFGWNWFYLRTFEMPNDYVMVRIKCDTVSFAFHNIALNF